MSISVGDRLPPATFRVMTADGPVQKSTDEVFKGKRVVLFAVPGAFTPTCHRNHLPGYVAHADAIKAKGVDTIAVVAVNDPFVMGAWENASGAAGKVLFLSDADASFATALGLSFDASGAGLGVRSRRYAMVVEDGVVKTLQLEDSPGKAELSTAETILALL